MPYNNLDDWLEKNPIPPRFEDPLAPIQVPQADERLSVTTLLGSEDEEMPTDLPEKAPYRKFRGGLIFFIAFGISFWVVVLYFLRKWAGLF